MISIVKVLQEQNLTFPTPLAQHVGDRLNKTFIWAKPNVSTNRGITMNNKLLEEEPINKVSKAEVLKPYEIKERPAGVGKVMKKAAGATEQRPITSAVKKTVAEQPIPNVARKTTAMEDIGSGLKKMGESAVDTSKGVVRTVGSGIKKIGEEMSENPGAAAGLAAGAGLATYLGQKLFSRPKTSKI